MLLYKVITTFLLLLGNASLKVLSKHKIFPERKKKRHLLQTFFSPIKKKNRVICCVCGHGSFPLTRLCCSVRLLRSVSMCLALSHVSLHREGCPRLKDSNLPRQTQAHFTENRHRFGPPTRSSSECVGRNAVKWRSAPRYDQQPVEVLGRHALWIVLPHVYKVIFNRLWVSETDSRCPMFNKHNTE